MNPVDKVGVRAPRFRRTQFAFSGEYKFVQKQLFGRLVLCVALWTTASGCITIAPSAGSPLSFRSFLDRGVQQANYEEPVEEAPPDPKDPTRLKLAYARWMEEMGQAAEARQQYSDVAKEEPENVEALLGLARLDLLSGNVAEAERRLQHAMRLAPEKPAVQFGWGQYLAAQKRWQESIGPLRRAMLARPANAGYRQQLAIALVHAGDTEAALPHFTQTVGEAEAHYNVALILKDEGQLEEAERQLVLALAKKPDMEPAQRWLTEIRQQRGEPVTTTAAAHGSLPTDRTTIPSAPVPANAPRFFRPISGRQGHSTIAMSPGK